MSCDDNLQVIIDNKIIPKPKVKCHACIQSFNENHIVTKQTDVPLATASSWIPVIYPRKSVRDRPAIKNQKGAALGQVHCKRWIE